MPYVEVWVENKCDADCPTFTAQLTAIKDALRAIRSDHVDDAREILARACDDKEFKVQQAKELELKTLLDQWRSSGAYKDDFLTFAHKRRKLTAA